MVESRAGARSTGLSGCFVLTVFTAQDLLLSPGQQFVQSLQAFALFVQIVVAVVVDRLHAADAVRLKPVSILSGNLV